MKNNLMPVPSLPLNREDHHHHWVVKPWHARPHFIPVHALAEAAAMTGGPLLSSKIQAGKSSRI
jgi:hypothetical protein